MAATTLDPNNKAAGFALSGGNLIATSTAVAAAAATRSLTGPSYGEVAVTTLTGVIAVGFVNRSYNMAVGTILGTDANGLSFKSTGAVVLANATLATIQTYAAGDVVCWAINPKKRLVWFRTNGGNWNNSGAANPATDTGGIDISTFAFGTLLPAIGCSLTGAVLAANFSGAFAQTPPTGYITVDTSAAVAINSDVGLTATYVLPYPARKDPSATVGKVKASLLGATYGRFMFQPAGAPTAISGTVKEVTTPVAKDVMLYDRYTGQFLGRAVSDPVTGAFTIPAVGRTSVFAVAFDPNSFQMLGFDRLTPV